VRRLLDHVRLTIVGGLLFVLPLLIVYFVLEKAIALIDPIVHDVAAALGIEHVIGIAGRVLISIATILLGAFVVGLFAGTRAGQAILHWFEQGIAMALPRFSIIQRMARELNGAGGDSMPVVLVATDAGWQLGLLIEPPVAGWCPIFLPSSPEFTSGGVSYAHVDYVHILDMSLRQLWSVTRSRGAFSAQICTELAALQASGKLIRP